MSANHDIETAMVYNDNQIKSDSKRSWIVCLAAAILVGLSMGINNSFGVLFVSLLEEFKQSRTKTAWIGSLEFIWYMSLSPLCNYLTQSFGYRRVVFAGNLLFSLGIFLSTFAQNMDVLYFTYGILFGTGTTLLYISGITVLQFCFQRRLATATGLVIAANTFCFLWVAPLYEYLTRAFGWRNAGKLLSLVAAPLGIGCALFPSKEQLSQQQSEVIPTITLTSTLKGLLRNKAFLVWLVIMYLVYLGILIPYTHLFSFSQDIGIPTKISVYSLSTMCIFDAVGKVTAGKCLDYFGWDIYTGNSLAILGLAVSSTLLPLANNVSHLFLYSAVYGFAMGVQSLFVLIITPMLCTGEHSKRGVTYLFCALSLPGALGPVLAGWIYDTTRSYHLAFFISGGIFAAGACLGVILPLFVDNSNNNTAPTKEYVSMTALSTSLRNIHNIDTPDRNEVIHGRLTVV